MPGTIRWRGDPAHVGVLLLDEATAQVDSLTEAAIDDCIRRRATEGAVVTVAYRLSSVVDADTIVVMDEGRVHVPWHARGPASVPRRKCGDQVGGSRFLLARRRFVPYRVVLGRIGNAASRKLGRRISCLISGAGHWTSSPLYRDLVEALRISTEPVPL